MNKAKRKGSNLERKIVNWLKPKYPECMTTRNGSTYLDSRGIDVMNVPYSIQCKAGYVSKDGYITINYNKLLKDLKSKQTNINLPIFIVHEYSINGKTTLNIIMRLTTFIKLMKDRKFDTKCIKGTLKQGTVILENCNVRTFKNL